MRSILIVKLPGEDGNNRGFYKKQIHSKIRLLSA